MRRQFLYGAIVVLASSALAACEPYYYGPYGYGAYGPYGYGAYGPYGYGAYGPYGGYPPPPPPPNAAPPPAPNSAVPAPPAPPPVVPLAPPPRAAAQAAPFPPPGPIAVVPATCRKGPFWPFVREPGDCRTDAERFSNYPFADYPLLAPQ